MVIAAGGGNKYNKTYSDSLIAYALPEGPANQPPLVSYARVTASASSAPVEKTEHAVRELFDHKVHAPLKLQCAYCHKEAASGARAGFPTASVCMTCHSTVDKDKPDIQRVAAMQASKEIAPVAPVYRLPDFVFFRHSRHADAGIQCAKCHGDMYAQSQVRPVLAMKMAACVDCHRATSAKIACTTCHELSQ